METVVADLRQDVIQSIDSAYEEYDEPSSDLLVQNIKYVFVSSEDYSFPDLENQLIKSVEFHFSEGDNPRQTVIEKNIQAVFLSWRYKTKL